LLHSYHRPQHFLRINLHPTSPKQVKLQDSRPYQEDNIYKMRQTTTTAFVILSCLLFSGEQSDAFQQQKLVDRHHRTALQLLPEQGNQLAAAYNAALDHKEPVIEDEEQDNASHWRAIATSKSFLNRLFHKPSATKLDNDTTATTQEENNHSKFQLGTFLHNLSHPNLHNKAKDEIYLYPVIGFQFVEGCQDALPTLSHASIRMPTKGQKEEDVVGWYTACCKLDLYSDDVCHSPIIVESPEEAEQL
jgi:hypothetical protein